MSPIPGRVTGIYKNAGDWVRAGEPVIRVEDNRTILLVARLRYRDPIVINPDPTVMVPNSIMRVSTHLFDDPASTPTPITGRVVAARGAARTTSGT